jgi:hypothetical protein
VKAVRRPARATWTLAAATIYASLFVAWTWPLARSPFEAVAIPASDLVEGPLTIIGKNDQLLTIWGVARNADALLDLDVRRLIDHGQCYPTPDAAFLGEHMIEAGILGTPAYALTRDPVASYNLACLASITIAGSAMFALALYWTGSVPASFVAGLLFAFHPSRALNLIHLAVAGNHWAPFVLLCFENVLARARVRDFGWLALTATLQGLTGAYPLIALAVFGVPYGLVRLVQERRHLDIRRVTMLVAAVSISVAVVAWVLVPYLAGQGIWKAMMPRLPLFTTFTEVLFPGPQAVGLVALLLAFALPLALLVPARGAPAATAKPPLLAIAAGTLTCMLFASDGLIATGGLRLAPVYSWLREMISTASFVRVPAQLRVGVYLGLILFAAVAAARLLGALRPVPRVMSASVLLVVAAAELFYVPFATFSYGRDLTSAVLTVAPDREKLSAYAALGNEPGPVLDLPYGASVPWLEMPDYVFYSAYHRQPVAACYNSFLAPSYFAFQSLAAHLTRETGIRELAASGIRNVVVHAGRKPHDLFETFAGSRSVETLYRDETTASFRLRASGEPHSADLTKLAVRDVRVPRVLHRVGYRQWLTATVANTSDEMFVLRHPIAPIEGRLRFIAGNAALPWQEIALLPPLALAGGETIEMQVPAWPLPEPGTYQVDVEIPALSAKIMLSDLVTVQ